MTDESIITLFFERDEQAIGQTERAHGNFLRSLAFSILHDREDAGETVNDAYLKAWNSIPPTRPVYFRAFLARITRQLAINRLEKRTACKRGGGDCLLALEELADCLSDGAGDAADELALKESLERFLRTLPPQARQVFLRRYWRMQTVAEVADAMGMSVSKVKSMLMRTRERLKTHLIEEGFEK